MADKAALYRRLPQVNELLEDASVRAWAEREGLGREFVRGAARELLERLREAIGAGAVDEQQLERRLRSAGEEVTRVGAALLEPLLRRVVNGTGVVVHTNLGRAPWSAAAARRVAELAGGYLNLEFDLEAGRRGGRDEPVGRYVERLLPGVAAAVVNNNAAAVLLVLNTMAEGREVIVSRGQLVEIGGSFRIPEVMEKGFCRLREVGTTNRTRIDDFRAAIGPETGLLLAVHPSNYRLVGFTESVPLEQLVQLGREADVPVVEDLGSGTLVDLRPAGIEGEPTVGARLASGVDLLTFSGDKLLGGPQAGFILGKPEAVARVRANPLYRALRPGKESLLALEATLREYVAGRYEAIPTLSMIFASADALRERAESLRAALAEALENTGARPEVVETESRVGGGAAPEVGLPSWGVAIDARIGADELVRRLRATDPPLVARVADDRLLIDVRTLSEGDDEGVLAALRQALATARRGT